MSQILIVCLSLVLAAVSTSAQEATNTGQTTQTHATGKFDDGPAAEVEGSFDEAVAEFGILVGVAHACSTDEDLAEHETLVRNVYDDLLKSFGADQAYRFAVQFGYGTGEVRNESECLKAIDQWTDKYGAVSGNYQLIDGPEKENPK